MKFLPEFFSDTFDDMFQNSLFKSNTSYMKTDIKEKDGNYLLDMELPGFQKDDIHMELKDGYLTIQADRNTNEEEKDDAGNIIRRERFTGSCSRCFYIGEGISEDMIKANFENGELKVQLPKPQAVQKIEKKQYIPIE